MDSTSSLPRGFLWGAVRAGIKASGRADLSAIIAPATAAAAALYTTNKIQAAPLLIDRRHLTANGGRVHTVLINAGNANCATGEAGIAAAEQCCAAAAEAFGCALEAVFPSSTGIIGVPLPVEKVRAALGDTADHFAGIAAAIMTTDTRPKTAHAIVDIDGRQVRIAGVAKGAGMIHPQLAAAPHATMLVYLCTDAAAEPALLERLLIKAGETSFNRISIDGDTSTNDTVLLLASGAAGVTLNDENAGGFAEALSEVCTSLAKQIVADAEGATHLVELNIQGAASDADALRIAKAIAHSPLVKTAWAGSDPNWG
ncbi:MAG TPA: bifunctional glutamate N-acetyltransferase/amino-acid acetyltransferase ArgJ, partial [Acidobacteriaceae bacterium]|nr:bifunctional glutamate N-acetyltransferase/amino-acid acetyltransferase ArgJ [Acidobacteriaceae bacterium]